MEGRGKGGEQQHMVSKRGSGASGAANFHCWLRSGPPSAALFYQQGASTPKRAS